MTCPMCDPEGYRWLMFDHSESHERVGTDPELCQEDDCPHWHDLSPCDCGAESSGT